MEVTLARPSELETKFAVKLQAGVGSAPGTEARHSLLFEFL